MNATRRTYPTNLDTRSFLINLKAEQGCLGCIMLAGDQDQVEAKGMLAQLKPHYFADLRDLNIFKALKRVEAVGQPLNVTSVVMAMKGGKVETSYIVALLDQVPSPAQFPVYLKELKDKACRRSIYEVSQLGMKFVNNEEVSPEDILKELHAQFNSIAQKQNPLAIQNAKDFLKEDMPDTPELIHGLLSQGAKMMLSGPAKVGKTWLLLDLATAVCSGTPWLGFSTTQGRVLYINLELRDCKLHERLKSILGARGLPEDDMGGLDVLNRRGLNTSLEFIPEQLAPQISHDEYALIIIDPIYKLLGDRDENNVSAVTGMVNGLEALAKETGAAVLFAHHFAKGNQAGKEGMDRPSGSSVFARDPDTGLVITPHKEKDCFTVEASILRDFPPIEPFVIRRNFPVSVRDDTIDPKDLKRPAKSKPARVITIEDIMPHVPLDGTPIGKAMLGLNANQSGIALNKINPIVNQAVDDGILFEWQKKREGKRPAIMVSRKPQPPSETQIIHTSLG